MFILYNGNSTGSLEVRLVEKVDDIHWGMVRRNAVRTLRRFIYDLKAADTLEQFPFELWKATNGFGDQFEVLYMKIPAAKYLEIELTAGSYNEEAGYKRIAEAMDGVGNAVRFIGMDADVDGSVAVATPNLQVTSVEVVRALADTEVLINSKSGPISCVDRIHTALHGYLKAICDDAAISYPPDADVTSLFQRIRDNHPKLAAVPSSPDEVNVFRGLARIVGALNPLRNSHSMAHPTPTLMAEPEAMLVVNAVRSLLHYFNMKLS